MSLDHHLVADENQFMHSGFSQAVAHFSLISSNGALIKISPKTTVI